MCLCTTQITFVRHQLQCNTRYNSLKINALIDLKKNNREDNLKCNSANKS